MSQQPQAAATPPAEPRGDALEGVQARRERLHTAIVDVDGALARSADGQQWAEGVRVALHRAHATLELHVEEAEAPDGLLAQIIYEEPVFGPRVAELEREHEDLLERSGRLLARCEELGPDRLREGATELVRRIDDHRHRAAGLLLDAYQLDLAAGD